MDVGPSPNASPGVPARTGAIDLPTLLPEAVRNRVPTRVRIPDLAIDLPVIVPPSDPGHYPYCNVAEFLPTMSRPGRPGTTFIYAHARRGMFLPILEASRVRDGRSMLGISIDVYTDDDRRFTYEVAEVRRHVTSLESAYLETAPQLILQTSEGPHGTPGKTMLVATPTGETAADPDDSHPTAAPIACD
jgi:hypothetical protein